MSSNITEQKETSTGSATKLKSGILKMVFIKIQFDDRMLISIIGLKIEKRSYNLSLFCWFFLLGDYIAVNILNTKAAQVFWNVVL
jgi:hypothetical protein